MPLLSGFTAIPNPYMIPFMGYQSWVIGSMFGMAYQGYKRKMSAMTNEEFNKLDLTTFGMQEMRKMTQATPQMETMFAEMRPMLDIMAKELNQLIASLPDLFKSVTSGDTNPTSTGGITGAGSLVDVPPPQNTTTVLKGIPAFLTPFIGPSGALQAIADLPPDVVKKIITNQKAVHPSSNFYAHWVQIVKTAITLQKLRDASQLPPTHQGPQIPSTPKPPKNTLTTGPGGELIINDDRNVKKPSPPSQIIKEYKLLIAEYNALSILKHNSPYRNYAWTNIPQHIQLRKNWATNQAKTKALLDKWDL